MKHALVLLLAAALLLLPVSALAKTDFCPNEVCHPYDPSDPCYLAPGCKVCGGCSYCCGHQENPVILENCAPCPTAKPSSGFTAKPVSQPLLSEPVPTCIPLPASTPEATPTPLIPKTGSTSSLSSLFLLPVGALLLLTHPRKKQS